MFIHISLLFAAILGVIATLSLLFITIREIKLLRAKNNALQHTKDNLTDRLNQSDEQINNLDLDYIINNSKIVKSYICDLYLEINKRQELIDNLSKLDEDKYQSRQALLPEMQRDSTRMFNLVDYLRKYSDVYSASELLDEWDRNKLLRSINERKEFDAFNSAIDRETFAKDVSSFLQKVKSRQPFQTILERSLVTLNGDFDEHIISCVIQSILLELGFVNNPLRYPTKPYNYGLSYPEITEKHEFFGFVSERDNTKQFILAFRLIK